MTQRRVLLNNFFLNQNFIVNNQNTKYLNLRSTTIRFSYFIELYCLEYFNFLFLINVYFLTNLSFFKKSKKSKKSKFKQKLKTFFL